ncbi:hypothetical protein FRB94_008083 [Tulasnella sp. JGI-2019a]|nr:hypothetical protein FRB94_008083 [Tulasnella sp. JGI-2019a]
MWEGVMKDLEAWLKLWSHTPLDDTDACFLQYEDGRTWTNVPREWTKPHLEDVNTDMIVCVLRADPVHQRASATQQVKYAAAVARVAQMNVMTTLRGMDDAADIATMEWLTTYRTRYDDGWIDGTAYVEELTFTLKPSPSPI